MLYRYIREHYENNYLKKIQKSIRCQKRVLQWGDTPDDNPDCAEILQQIGQIVDFRQKQRLAEMGLPVVDGKPAIILWPTFFDTVEKENNKIDICPACFGALIFHRTNRGKNLEDEMNAAMRTIILLRNQDGSWPSCYSVDKSIVYSGTFNQTTIALATLMRYNFLDISILPEHLEKRLEFFRESMHWLLGKRRKNFVGISWGFSPSQEKTFSSTMQTAFIYEILIKYRNIMLELPDKYCMMQGQEKVDDLNVIISGVEDFFTQMQKESGGFSKKIEKEGDKECFVNTCMVINALASNPDSELNRQVMQKAAKYLIDVWRFKSAKVKVGKLFECGRGFYLTWDECFETFKINVLKKSMKDDGMQAESQLETEVFERFPHTLIILSCISLLRTDKSYPFLTTHKKYILRKYIKKSLKLLEKTIIRQEDSIYVKGFRGGDCEYPIYNLYYAMLVFSKIIEQGEELHLGILPVDMLDICKYSFLVVVILLLIGLFRNVFLISAALTALLGVSVERLWQGISSHP